MPSHVKLNNRSTQQKNPSALKITPSSRLTLRRSEATGGDVRASHRLGRLEENSGGALQIRFLSGDELASDHDSLSLKTEQTWLVTPPRKCPTEPVYSQHVPCSCLPALPGLAWVLLSKIYIPFSRSLYCKSLSNADGRRPENLRTS